LQKRKLGKTGQLISIIGLGTVKFGRNQGVKYPAPFELPTDQVIKNLLANACDLGINLIDTAPAYGTSEERLGKHLYGIQSRDKWVISTKVGETFVDGISRFDFSKEAVRESVDRSLKRLRTDYLDIVLVHSDGRDVEIILEDEIFLTLEDLKKEGKARAFGMSSKTIEGGCLTLESSDVAMVEFNQANPDQQKVIEYASALQKGIFIKKALHSGHLSKIGTLDPVSHAMQFIFAQKSITSVIVGTLDPTHLKENVEKALQVLAPTI
jgi:aryl-alcohol dehydrogenase-like predicted oxidoreductase